MAPGTSGVLELIFGTLCEPGKSILIPRPHFTIYGCLAGALDITLNSYKLMVWYDIVCERTCNVWECKCTGRA